MLQRRSAMGFTLVELMITIVVAAIVLALAVPSYRMFVEKRQLTAAAETIVNFIATAQSMAIRRNEIVNFSWDGSSSHSADFCMGVASGSTACDCWETDPDDGDFCAVNGLPYRLTKTDFVKVGHEFLHFRPSDGDFSFDPIRGSILRDTADANFNEYVDGDYLFYMHSDEGSGSSRLFGLEIKLWITGQTEICYQESRKMVIGGYPDC